MARPVAITWEALRPILPCEGGNSRSNRTKRLCVGAFASRSKISRAIRSKSGREHIEIAVQGGPLPHASVREISKANSVRSGVRAGARKTRDA